MITEILFMPVLSGYTSASLVSRSRPLSVRLRRCVGPRKKSCELKNCSVHISLVNVQYWKFCEIVDEVVVFYWCKIAHNNNQGITNILNLRVRESVSPSFWRFFSIS